MGKAGTEMSKILIIEDEVAIADLEKDYLELSDFQVDIRNTGDEGLVAALTGEYNLVILDLMLPGMDGFEVCRKIREEKNIPILMVSAKKDDIDKIRGLGLGADDYMTKPFSPKVLLAKTNALLRRSSVFPENTVNTANAVCGGNISILPSARKVFLEGEEITLTHKEYELLYFLMSNPGQIFSREQLLNRIWGYDFEGTTRTVDTHIKTLRQKLGGEGRHIITLIRSGYKFEVTL